MIENPPVAPALALWPTRTPSAGPAPRRFPDRFTVKSEGSFIFLRCTEIDWIEAQGDYVRFHLGPRNCLVRMTMKTLGQNIDPAKFLRVHRSTFVNIDRIEKIGPFRAHHHGVVLRDGTRLRISTSYRTRVRQIYLAALNSMRSEGPMLTSPVAR